MKKALLGSLFLACALAQRPQPKVVVPDGLIPGTKKEDHRVDLSGCDEVTASFKLDYASIIDGVITVYAFKKYGHGLSITCTVVGK